MVQNFFAHANNIEASIKFTIEYEKEDTLSFLDISGVRSGRVTQRMTKFLGIA